MRNEAQEPKLLQEDVRAEYETRLEDRQAAHERWSRVENRIADARLLVMLAGLVLVVLLARAEGKEFRYSGR